MDRLLNRVRTAFTRQASEVHSHARDEDLLGVIDRNAFHGSDCKGLLSKDAPTLLSNPDPY